VLDDAVRAVLTAYPTIHSAFRRREVRDAASGRRLSDHQAGILDHLDPDVPITVGELAGRLRVTPATASLQLDQLTRLRLVVRERDEVDGRRVRLRLTEAGTRIRRLRSLLDPDRVREAMARLAPPEQEAVAAGLRLLARGAGELPKDFSETPRAPRATRRTPKR
jgi:MarR family transcriptional regulator, organic hydroperoxide resistance regulator